MNTPLERPKGTVKIEYTQLDNTPRQSIIDNAVVSNAKKLISRALGGDPDYLIDTVEIWLGAVLLASTGIVVTFETVDTVRFNAVFREDDFSGNFDKLVLKNAVHGNFSEVTGISESKSATEKMAISWDIKPQ